MVARVKAIFIRLIHRLAALRGWQLLTRQQTENILSPNVIASQPEGYVSLSEVRDAGNPGRIVFPAKTAVTPPAWIWQLPAPTQTSAVLPCGALKTGDTVLCTDYWNHQAFLDQLRPRSRPVVYVETLVAPFGHHQDPLTFGGYYDFMCLIMTKLCRMEASLPSGFTNMAIAYPLFNTPYEVELLTYLGFAPENIFDSRQTEVRARQYLLGSGGDWFYPGLSDVEVLHKRLMPLVKPPTQTGPSRIYISRAGRRRVVNEEALMTMLSQYGFVYVEEKSGSLSEQLSLFRGAGFIIGPHGASFTNINWCSPGTYLHELCSVNYAPDFFQYLAQVRQLHYSVSLHGKLLQQRFRKALVEDINVSIPVVERHLNQLLQSQTQQTLS